MIAGDLENTVEIKEHVCREKLVRPSGSEADVKRAKCTNVVSGKRQTENSKRHTEIDKRQTANCKRQTANGKRQSQNANLALHFVVRDQHGTKGNLLLVEGVLLSASSKKVSQF